ARRRHLGGVYRDEARRARLDQGGGAEGYWHDGGVGVDTANRDGVAAICLRPGSCGGLPLRPDRAAVCPDGTGVQHPHGEPALLSALRWHDYLPEHLVQPARFIDVYQCLAVGPEFEARPALARRGVVAPNADRQKLARLEPQA